MNAHGSDRSDRQSRYSAKHESLADGLGTRTEIFDSETPITFAKVLEFLQSDPRFRTFFNSLLAGSSFEAFRWETPAVTSDTADRHFECVLLDSPRLARTPDPLAFAKHFEPDQDVVVFPNLGRDATMVVPCPKASPSAYGHLGAFVREAPEAQIHALWRAVGEAMQHRLGRTPVWLSTAGAGVSWLHVRLDDRPKYYGYEPYRTV